MKFDAPRPHTVTVAPFQVGATDPLGNDIEGWGTPTAIAVYGWGAPKTVKERIDSHQNRIIVELELYLPDDEYIGDRDKVTVNGRTYLAVGEVEDMTHGPFGFEPGGVVNLIRTEG